MVLGASDGYHARGCVLRRCANAQPAREKTLFRVSATGRQTYCLDAMSAFAGMTKPRTRLAPLFRGRLNVLPIGTGGYHRRCGPRAIWRRHAKEPRTGATKESAGIGLLVTGIRLTRPGSRARLYPWMAFFTVRNISCASPEIYGNQLQLYACDHAGAGRTGIGPGAGSGNWI